MKAFKQLDLYRKVSADHSSQTLYGGLITLFAFGIMSMLLISEVKSYLTPSILKQTLVDQGYSSDSLRANIDITLPYAPCLPLSLDQQDDINKHVLDSTENLIKIRLDKNGSALPGALERTMENLQKAIKDGEGCRIKGFINILKVPGNFHISFHVAHSLVQRLSMNELRQLRFNHVINHLSFGSEDTSSLIEAEFTADDILSYDGLRVEDPAPVSKHEYFLRVVPLQFINERTGVVFNSNTFSMNRQSGEFHSYFGAIYFRYSFEDLTMRYTKSDKGAIQLVVSLCAILGGAFTMLGLLNKLVN